MHLPSFAGPGRRTRRAILAAALPAAVAATALPAPADAATVSVSNGTLRYQAGPGESNRVNVRFVTGSLLFQDQVAIAAGSGCRINAGEAVCRPDVDLVQVDLSDRSDSVAYRAPHGAVVAGGTGDDSFEGGVREPSPRVREALNYVGGPGRDLITYASANRGVRVDTASSLVEDGRPGDLEFVHEMETIEGSNFGDTLLGSDANDLLRGLNGDDTIEGRGGDDIFDEGSAPNGADAIFGDAGTHDRVFYSTRTSGVEVSLGDGRRNDGATGEQDNVGGSVEDIGGTNFRDVLTGGSPANTIEGFGGPDTITGGLGNDTLSVGAGNNSVFGGTGNDVIETRNGEIDNIDCGENSNDSDTANRDTDENRVTGCERGTVGVLSLSPERVRAEAGTPVRLRLSWRHPQDWRKLRRIALRLTVDGAPVGEITIRARGERISAEGAVQLVRKHTRLTHKGKTVTARLALRLDDSLAGQALTAEVEASDRRGRRQVERDAATVRVVR